ncbi:hypothetical protein B0H17DRAFT_1080866, partial [Mycena rosella]
MRSKSTEPIASSDFEELDELLLTSSPSNCAQPSRSRFGVVPSSEPNSNAGPKLDRRSSGLFDIGRATVSALKNLVSGTQILDASEVQVQEALEAASLSQAELDFTQQELKKSRSECRDLKEQIRALQVDEAALEAASLSQAELHFTQQELRKSESECGDLKEHIRALQADGQHASLEAVIQRLKADVQNAQETIRRLKDEAEAFQTERANLLGISDQHSAYIGNAHAKIDELMQQN